jgi:hypothetical protein
MRCTPEKITFFYTEPLDGIFAHASAVTTLPFSLWWDWYVSQRRFRFQPKAEVTILLWVRLSAESWSRSR